MSALHRSAAMGPLLGLVLLFFYCMFASGADALTRVIAQDFSAAQMYCLSGGLVVALSYLANLAAPGRETLKTKRPRTMALRSALVVAACVSYFMAFRGLPFADVFVFIGLVPIFVALLSGPILGEAVRWQSWCALIAGVCGVMMLYPPTSLSTLTFAHLSGLLGAVFGALSMTLSRHISRDDRNALVQVFYPNLALCVSMLAALPFVFKPMALWDVAIVAAYSVLLFFARWLLVMALARVKSYVATPLMNVQFVIMIAIGYLAFGEVPSANLIAGACVIIAAGSYLVLEQMRAVPRQDAVRHRAIVQRRVPAHPLPHTSGPVFRSIRSGVPLTLKS